MRMYGNGRIRQASAAGSCSHRSRSWGSLLLSGFLLLWLCWTSYAQEEQRFYYRFGGTMDLSPIEDSADLTPDAIAKWESLTADFYILALEGRTDLDPPIRDPQVSVSLIFAAPPSGEESVLAMQYRATASFVTSTNAYDPGVLALPRFRSQDAVLQYVIQLRQSGFAVYQDLMSLSLTVQASTPIPAPSPTLAPIAPTQDPTKEPTRSPTPEPTRAPTKRPTLAPVRASLTAPPTTRAPVVDETKAPTSSPTPRLTMGETIFVTDPPTSQPVPEPTNLPTPPPQPSPPGLQTKYATTELNLRLVPSEEMQGQVLEDWKSMTISYLLEYIRALDESLLQEEDQTLEIEKVTQTSTLEDVLEGRRTLQQNVTNLYLLDLEFVSKLTLPPSYDANSLVNGAFATRSRREAYRQTLMELSVEYEPPTRDYFQYLTEVTLGDENGGGGNVIGPPGNNNNNQKDDGKSNTGAIVGGVVGGLVLILILVVVVYRWNSQDTSKDTTSSGEGRSAQGMAPTDRDNSPSSAANGNPKSNGHNTPATGLTWEPAEQPSRLNQEIVVNENGMDDVSTIGDPYLYGAQPPQEDERTATTSVFQTETYHALLGRPALHPESSLRSTAEDTEFSAFTGASKYLQNQPSTKSKTLLGELGIHQPQTVDEETSFEQRLFPMDSQKSQDPEERSLDYSLPTALM
mmetsp:Transcript_112305/g.324397  ORF Transcript_112305/g.324397 Transcript_112305/m.324397 type:complete len:687 (+) Transcript_112305:293-2353(+)